MKWFSIEISATQGSSVPLVYAHTFRKLFLTKFSRLDELEIVYLFCSQISQNFTNEIEIK